MGRLKGQNVIVTGASSGFGEAIAIACAAAGANVSLPPRVNINLISMVPTRE